MTLPHFNIKSPCELLLAAKSLTRIACLSKL